MISFTHPAYLWTLSGLAIPVAIHLLSRKEGKIIYVGSLRHLQESNTRQSLNIRLNELLLLALRMLMITFLVFWMAGLQINNGAPQTKKWVLIEQGIQHQEQLLAIFDSLKGSGYEMRFLAPEFPKLTDSLEVQQIANYRDLARELQHQDLENAVVFSFNRLESFRGQNMPLPDSFQWIAVEPEPSSFAQRATRIDDSHILLRKGLSNPNETNYETLKLSISSHEKYYKLPGHSDSIPIHDLQNQLVLVVTDSTFKDDAAVLLAALQAIQESPNFKIDIKTAGIAGLSSINNPDWIIWLSLAPYSKIQSANQIIFKPDLASPILKQYNQHTWLLTKNLNEGVALKENLPIRLSEILAQDRTLRSLASKYDRRTLDESMSWTKNPNSNTRAREASVAKPEEATGILALLILTLLIERVIAHHKKQ